MKKISYCLLSMFLMFIVINPVFAEMEACNTYLDITIDSKLANIVHYIVLIIQIVVPILLVIFGSIDFVKAVIAQKDDEIKKGQQTFMKRAIAAIIVFFVVSIVRLVVSFGAGKQKANILNCAECFLSGPSSEDCLKTSTNVSSNTDETKADNKSSQTGDVPIK